MNTKLQLTDSVQDVLMKMSEGNPGALTVCVQILQENGLGVILSLDELGLHGPKIWMLYSDVCKRDLPTMLAVLRGWQLGFISDTKLKQAIEDYGRGLDIPAICAQVTQRLPNFRLTTHEPTN